MSVGQGQVWNIGANPSASLTRARTRSKKAMSLVQLGHDEATKEMTKEEQKHEEKFDDLLERSEKILFRTKSFFPFDLFPDEIIVSVHKVDIIYNEFLTRRIQPVYIQNIWDVFVDNGIFFSTLHLIDAGFANNTVVMNNLINKDAISAMKTIQGLVVAVKQNIDLTKIDSKDLVEKVRTLGTTKNSY